MTKSLFQNVEIVAEKTGEEIAADFQAAWAHIEAFYTKDVKPIVSATLQYVETNGATELLKIAERVVSEAVAAVESGGIANLGEFLVGAAGTVIDEAKQAGITIAEGAAHLATSMAFASTQTATAGSTSNAGNASDGSSAGDQGGQAA